MLGIEAGAEAAVAIRRLDDGGDLVEGSPDGAAGPGRVLDEEWAGRGAEGVAGLVERRGKPRRDGRDHGLEALTAVTPDVNDHAGGADRRRGDEVLGETDPRTLGETEIG